MGIEPIRTIPQSLQNAAFREALLTACHWRANFHVMRDNVGLRETTTQFGIGFPTSDPKPTVPNDCAHVSACYFQARVRSSSNAATINWRDNCSFWHRIFAVDYADRCKADRCKPRDLGSAAPSWTQSISAIIRRFFSLHFLHHMVLLSMQVSWRVQCAQLLR